LRGVRGRDLLDATTRFVLQPRSEQTPCASPDASVEAALLTDLPAGSLKGPARTASHRTHVEGFNANGVEAPRDVSGGLFDPASNVTATTDKLPKGDATLSSTAKARGHRAATIQ
jgi:hypothetical protein